MLGGDVSRWGVLGTVLNEGESDQLTSSISPRINYTIPSNGHISFAVSMIILQLPRALKCFSLHK